MTITQMQNGYVKLTPDAGKTLLCKLTNSTHSEAIVKRNEIGRFMEVQDNEKP